MHKLAKWAALALLLVLVLGTLLTGCSQPGGDDGTPTGDTGKESPGTTDTDEPAPQEGGETLSLWTWKLGYQDGFHELAKVANMTLEIEAIGEDAAYRNKLVGAANAGTLPDIVHYWGSPDIEISPSLLDLSITAPFNTEEFKAPIYSQAWEAVTVSEGAVKNWGDSQDASAVQKAYQVGQYFLVPLDVGGFYTIYANKALLEEANIPTDIPATYEELIDRMIAYKEATGGAGLACSTQIPDLVRNWMWSALELMYNGIDGYAEILDPFSEVPVNSERHLVPIRIFETLTENELWVPGSLSMSIDEGDQSFFAEKAAYLLGGSFTAATLQAMGMDLNDVYSFPVPPLEGSMHTEWSLTPFCLTGLGISSNSQQQEAAIRYLTTFTTADGALAFANSGYSIPAVDLGDRVGELTDVLSAAAATYVTDGSDLISQFNEKYPVVKDYGGHPWIARFDNAIQEIIMGTATAEDAAQAVDDSKAEEIKLGNVTK